MGRYILRFTGRGAAPDVDSAKIRAAPGLTILDSSSSRMFLVEASSDTIRQLAESLPGWNWSQEQMIPLPDPRPKLRPS
jgi:hypothetical protein